MLLFPAVKMKSLLFTCLIVLLLSFSNGEGESPTSSCDPETEDITIPCRPCGKEEQLQLLASGEETNPDKTCFNNDPTKTGSVIRNPGPIVVAVGKFRKSQEGEPKTFKFRKQGFFRYAVDINNPSAGGGGDSDPYLDLDKMQKYYERTPESGKKINVDFQLLEWPGRKSSEQKEALENLTATGNPIGSAVDNKTCNATDALPDEDCPSTKMWMLEFGGSNAKVLHYPCNTEEGVEIVAVGSVDKTEDELTEVTSKHKIWLAHGLKSIFNDYIYPLFAPHRVLKNMAKEEGPDCPADDEKLEDLRTVLDFGFADKRLVLGMKCGIVIVSELTNTELEFEASILKSETGKTSVFPEPITHISASACCTSLNLCSRDESIIAAYSFKEDREPEDRRFMYVSFDLGYTFEKKIISSAYSPVNLIKGLFKFYIQWEDYFELLHNPDEQDLKDDEDTPMLKKLREKPMWDMLSTESKEKRFAAGVRIKDKHEKIVRTIVEIVEKRVPKRRERRKKRGINVDEDKTPAWANYIINKRRQLAGWQDSWTDENCDDNPECTEKFENDTAVDWLLGEAGVRVKTPKRNESELFCKEIVSILVLSEERHVMGLCEIGLGNGDTNSKRKREGEGSSDIGHFALYNYHLKENIPLIHGYRISQRIFTCKYTKNEDKTIRPEIFRVPGSSTLFIKNCEGKLYLSTNFGNTLYNAAFYYEHNLVKNYCTQDSNFQPDDTNHKCNEDSDSNENDEEKLQYLRTFQLCALNVPPLITADKNGNILLMTFGKFYAKGAIVRSRELRLVVATALNELPFERRFDTIIVPTINTIGEAVLTVSLTKAYSIPSTAFKEKLYKDRHAIRLLEISRQFHSEIQNYFSDNLSLCKSALQRKHGYPKCTTLSFSLKPSSMSMDINEEKAVNVRIFDNDRYSAIPLWVFSSNENSVGVTVRTYLDKDLITEVERLNLRSKPLHLHTWEVIIRTLSNHKNANENESLVDAFYGSDYSTLNDYSTQIDLVNSPTIRCHVQPSAIVRVEIGCQGKRLVAHEDAYRPQCSRFKNFKYKLKKGNYDPELANFWLANELDQIKPFFKLLPNGDLEISYDYRRWGCPLEPFRSDPFLPDLRILEKNETNTAEARRFQGKFVLIELFGAKGFYYSLKVRDAKCNRPPQKLKELVKEWIYRQRSFFVASKRIRFPNSTANLTTSAIENITINEVLENDAVRNPINIWNRANYLTCGDAFDTAELPINILDDEYEVLETRKWDEDEEEDSAENAKFRRKKVDADVFDPTPYEESQEEYDDTLLNKIIWGKNHQRVYLFLAVAVDEYGSLCNYHTVFGVSLKTNPDWDDVLSFIIFLLFVCLWLLLVICGYLCRKRYLRVSYYNQIRDERLEQAAWTVIYRYEKLVHGRASDGLFDTMINDKDPTATTTKSVHDKRRDELRIKRAHLMAQQQAKHERLQKLFQKL